MSDTNLTLQLAMSKPMHIRVSPMYIEKPSYMMVGIDRKVRRGIKGYNLLGAVLNFTAGMQQMFKFIVDGLDINSNCCDFIKLNLSKSQQNTFALAYKELSKIDLVKRMSKGVYMVNPRAIIPPKTYPEAQILWDSKPNKNLITSSTEELQEDV